MRSKKLISILVAIMLLFALAGCFDSGVAPNPDEAQTEQAALKTAEAASAVPTEALTAEPTAAPTAEPTAEPTALPTAVPYTPAPTIEPTDITWAEYNAYCLDILHGGEPEAVNPQSLYEASNVFFEISGEEVNVYEEGHYLNGWSLTGLIRSLPVEAFEVTEDMLLSNDTMLAAWYAPPSVHPDRAFIYDGYLGEDWAMIVSEPATGHDGALLILTDDNWQTFRYADGTYNIIKTCGGRCGENLFLGYRYGEKIIDFFRSDDLGVNWQTVELSVNGKAGNPLYNPLTPVFEGQRGLLPVHLYYIDGINADTLTYFITDDGGVTWKPL